MKAIIAMLCITGLEIVAITQGIDGVLLAGSCAVIAGLGGFSVNKVRLKKKGTGTPPSAE